MSASSWVTRRLRPVDQHEFSKIQHGFDRTLHLPVAKILPGEFYATSDDELITTTLGSCVSACLWSPEFGVGGMNHFMLPEAGPSHIDARAIQSGGEAARYGSFAMEHLINAILATGLRREDLRAKIVGGGKVLSIATDIGARNIEFVRAFLATEGIEIIGENVGGDSGRQVRFRPATGGAQVRSLGATSRRTIASEEDSYRRSLKDQPATGDIEMF